MTDSSKSVETTCATINNSATVNSSSSNSNSTIDRDIEQIILKIQSNNGFSIKDRLYLFKTYKNCFIGYEAVDWLYSNVASNMTCRADAVKLGQKLLDMGVFTNLCGAENVFRDDYFFYEFTMKKDNNGNNNSNTNNINNQQIKNITQQQNKSRSGSASTPRNNNSVLDRDELIQLGIDLMHSEKGIKLSKKKKGFLGSGSSGNCFSGQQLLEWLMKKLEISKRDALNIASNLLQLNIFIESKDNINQSSNNLLANNSNNGNTIPTSISLSGLNLNTSHSSTLSNTTASQLSLSTSSLPPSSLSLSSSTCLLNPIPTPTPNNNNLNISSTLSLSSNLLFSSTSTVPSSTTTTTNSNTRMVEDSLEVYYEFLTKPETIINHVSIKKLDELCLSHKSMTSIPTTIINTSKYLKILDLSFNNLSDPNQLESIPTLYNLEQCNLSHNNLSQLPNSFIRLESLVKLNLNHNNFVNIPPIVYQIPHIEELCVASNLLTQLSESIGRLKYLERLNVKNNKITRIPKEICLLTNLKYFNISGFNKIIELPPFLSNLPNLEQLEFPDSVKFPPKSITSKGFQHIVGYLKDFFEGTELLPYIKLMVLGSERTGRTALVKALAKSQQKSLSKQSAAFLKKVSHSDSLTNDPIEITEFKMDLPLEFQQKMEAAASATNLTPDKKQQRPSKKNIKLMTYDFKFANNDVYYHTHQFFLSERAFYLITYDINKDLLYSNIDFWVNSIQQKAPNAPIYIVATHIDTYPGLDIMKPLNDVEAYLNSKCLEVTGVIGVSSSNFRNIDLLKQEILSTLTSGLHSHWITEKIPSIYVTLQNNLREEAKKRQPPIVTWEEYQNIAKLSNFNENSLEKLVRATNTLNRWGSLMWFDDPKSSLKDIIILSPQWLSDCFNQLLMAKHTFVSTEAILMLSNLKNIWKSIPDYYHIKLLKVLEKFQIIFTLKNNQQQSNSALPSPILNDNNIAGNEEKTNDSTSPPMPSINPLSNSSNSAFIHPSLVELLSNVSANNGGSPKSLRHSLKALSKPRSDSGSFISFNRIIIPCLLPKTKPSHLTSLWDTWSGEDEHQIGRYFQFTSSPKSVFDRLMVRFLYMMEPIIYWSTGILFRKTQNYKESLKNSMTSCGTLVEYDVGSDQLQIRVRGHEFEACAKLFQIILENVDTILKDFNITQPMTWIPCSCCTDCRDRPHLFPIDMIEEAFEKGEAHTKCPITQKLVCLSKMAPDITLSSVSSNKKILKEDLLNLEEIGIGGFAKVYKGEYKGQQVAIKQLNFERMDLDALSFNSKDKDTNSSNGGGSNNGSEGHNSLGRNNKLLMPSNFSRAGIQRNLSTSSLGSTSSSEDSSNSFAAATQGKLNAVNEFRREVWLMSSLSHPNIVTMKGFCFEPYSIVMEYMDLGSLSTFLSTKKHNGETLSWSIILKIAIDIAQGMSFLHNITPPLVHRDLKSPNILLASLPHEPFIVAKVSDFGLSRTVVQSFVSKVVDNPTWLAPEVLKGFEYNEKGDIYSFGMILWELYHMELPFDEFDIKFMSTLEDNILSGLRPSIDQNCNRMYASLITKCWNSDPQQRPSFHSILKILNDIKKNYQ
ncbi:hypothetical protein CYY_008735 [Polysphondylium violaceum]|uniref:non-specific serine/threonine protein kinase n=1 Tax=Polysphondylium violaceum TaxID=133409 RepID=A0A8J4PMM1_9MYCE|nr:hypothetical protein CYY_008735 [Polysphondylium violaceum]